MADGNGAQTQPGTGVITLTRTEPAEYVVLVAKMAKSGGMAVPAIKTGLPSGTELAKLEDLLLAGYVPVEWLAEAVAKLPKGEQDKVLVRFGGGPAGERFVVAMARAT